jgi:arylsulfatase A-like enzyme
VRALLLAGLVALGACAPAEAPAPRNVLLVVVDTLRADVLETYGYGKPTSPFLAAWAGESAIVFDGARASAPWTKPSVASFLTGLDPQHHGVRLHHEPLHSEVPTLGHVLRDRGFQTAAIQSNPYLVSLGGYAHGFDRYVEDPETVLARHDRSTGAALNEAALAWLRDERDPERPWFLWVQHYEPHHQYLRDGAAFHDGAYEGPLTGEESMDALAAAASLLSEADVAFLRARYDEEVRYQDELLAELFRGLDELGVLEDTLVVVTSDHGEEFKEHGDLSHQYKLYDELLEVPLLVALPGGAGAGRRVDVPVSLTDLPRTVLDLLGQADAEFPGRSFASLVLGEEGGAGPIRAHAATVRGEGDERVTVEREAWIEAGWKLVRDHDTGARELYDLAADPRERSDLAAREPERAARLEEHLDAWLEAHRHLEGARSPEHIEYSPEQLEILRALGY